MAGTDVRFIGKVVHHDPQTNPESGIVEGFYYQDLDGGVLKHYIRNCECIWEVKPETVHCFSGAECPTYENPITTIDNIKALQERLVQTVVDFVKEFNLTDVWSVSFSVDGISKDAIEYGEWTPGMDSCITVEGLQEEEGVRWPVRKEIGKYM